MERIKLSKNEKKILRLLNQYGQEALDTLPRSAIRRSLRQLEAHSFIRVAWVEGEDFEAVLLTSDGKDYLIENPKLRNPIDWKWWIRTAIGVATLIVVSLLLLILSHLLFSILNLQNTLLSSQSLSRKQSRKR